MICISKSLLLNHSWGLFRSDLPKHMSAGYVLHKIVYMYVLKGEGIVR